MSRTLVVSDQTYARLEAKARGRGFESVEALLEGEGDAESGAKSREEVADRIDEIFQYMSAKYGIMPDSADLIREDRER